MMDTEAGGICRYLDIMRCLRSCALKVSFHQSSDLCVDSMLETVEDEIFQSIKIL